MAYKKFIPCIYLYKGDAVKGFSDSTIIDTNPVALAKFYSDNYADELIVYDMSEGDAAHEEALDIAKASSGESRSCSMRVVKRRRSTIPSRATLKSLPRYRNGSGKKKSWRV